MAKKIIKKEAENKAMLEIVFQGLAQALLISLIILFLFDDGNATLTAMIDAIRLAKISSWEIAVIAFPGVFVVCTAVELVTYIIKKKEK